MVALVKQTSISVSTSQHACQILNHALPGIYRNQSGAEGVMLGRSVHRSKESGPVVAWNIKAVKVEHSRTTRYLYLRWEDNLGQFIGICICMEGIIFGSGMLSFFHFLETDTWGPCAWYFGRSASFAGGLVIRLAFLYFTSFFIQRKPSPFLSFFFEGIADEQLMLTAGSMVRLPFLSFWDWVLNSRLGDISLPKTSRNLRPRYGNGTCGMTISILQPSRYIS